MKRLLATLTVAAAAVLGLPAVSASAYTPPTIECFRAPCPVVPPLALFPPGHHRHCHHRHCAARFSWLLWAAAEHNKARPYAGEVAYGRASVLG